MGAEEAGVLPGRLMAAVGWEGGWGMGATGRWREAAGPGSGAEAGAGADSGAGAGAGTGEGDGDGEVEDDDDGDGVAWVVARRATTLAGGGMNGGHSAGEGRERV